MEFNLERLNKRKIELGEKPLELQTTTYQEPIVNNGLLVDKNGHNIGTKGDMYTKLTLNDILQRGCLDINPRPKYEDGEPAHTLSLNHGGTTAGIFTYDAAKGETPFITLRPIALNAAKNELFWIYLYQSNNLDLLKDLGVTWWDEWEVPGTRTIGSVYGETVRKYDLVRKVLNQMENDPDCRRNIISLWQENQFELPHGLKPCAYLTNYNIRHEWDGKDYLDMSLKQRSSDFCTAGCINQMQYFMLHHLFAHHLGVEVGIFSWQYDNIQIYDRHIDQAIEMLNREPITCSPKIIINENKQNFFDMTPDDVRVIGIPRERIRSKNPQLKFPLGI